MPPTAGAFCGVARPSDPSAVMSAPDCAPSHRLARWSQRGRRNHSLGRWGSLAIVSLVSCGIPNSSADRYQHNARIGPGPRRVTKTRPSVTWELQHSTRSRSGGVRSPTREGFSASASVACIGPVTSTRHTAPVRRTAGSCNRPRGKQLQSAMDRMTSAERGRGPASATSTPHARWPQAPCQQATPCHCPLRGSKRAGGQACVAGLPARAGATGDTAVQR